jgi:pimeloyl-ACP methyl ester carboxylesterase
MRLAAKWHGAKMRLEGFEEGRAQQVILEGGAVEVIRMGRGDPIVLVPGLAGGWRLLAPLARRLAGHHEVILVGLRGDREPLGAGVGQSMGGFARDLDGLITQLRLERPTVFGVSFGGGVALEWAVEHPRRVGALVVQGVEARFHKSLGSTIAARVLERFPLPNDNRFINQFFNLLHGGRPGPGPLAEFVVERCWETDQGVMARRLRALEGFDVADRLWRLDAPCLVLAGTRDVIVPAVRQRALAEAITGARFEALEGAGHIGFLTHGDEVARHVHRLIRARQRSLC